MECSKKFMLVAQFIRITIKNQCCHLRSFGLQVVSYMIYFQNSLDELGCLKVYFHDTIQCRNLFVRNRKIITRHEDLSFLVAVVCFKVVG